MHSDRWKTIEETFHAALQRPPEQRSAYLDSACTNDPELRREVQSLLDETTLTDSFMEQAPGGVSLASLDFEQPSLEGQVLNHYQIGALVGSGGMAEVYRARDTRLERDVAIKVLHNVRFLDRERLEPMYREARLLASLNHPNIAAIYGIEEGNGLCGIVLELVEGEALSERIKRGPLPIQEVLDIAKQVLAGLQAAHAKGIIHRDLKPSNITLTREGAVKIIDFGLAKLLRSLGSGDAVTDASRHGVVMGTLAYMSPEQARGKSIDARTDIWATGCVFYEMLAGKPAFTGDTPTDIIVKIATEEPDWAFPKLSERISDALQRLIRKCMQKNPDSRYQSVREIAAALETIHHGAQGLGSPPAATQTAPQRAETEDEFVLPGRSAPWLFMLVQAGYLALYTAAMYHIDAIAGILSSDFQIPATTGLIGTMVLAMCGVAVRLYLITSIGWHHPAAGRKFELLFPVLLILDSIWAASPLLLWRHLGAGLALTGVAMLAYVPFAERTLVRTLYPRRTLKASR